MVCVGPNPNGTSAAQDFVQASAFTHCVHAQHVISASLNPELISCCNLVACRVSAQMQRRSKKHKARRSIS